MKNRFVILGLVVFVVVGLVLVIPSDSESSKEDRAAKKEARKQERIKKRCSKKVPIEPGERYKHLKKWRMGCPQGDVEDPGVANLDINGVKVNIPRDNMLLGKRQSDGPALGVSLDFLYPSMKPARYGDFENKKYEISMYISAAELRKKMGLFVDKTTLIGVMMRI